MRLVTRDLERRLELVITRMGHSPQRLESLAANCVGKHQAKWGSLPSWTEEG